MSMVALKQPFFLQVMYDAEPLNPRIDYDNFGHMACWHSRYNLGDEHHFDDPNDFLKDLVEKTVSEDALIAYVRSGKTKDVELVYDSSRAGWEIGSYDHYFKKWYHGDFFEGDLKTNKAEIAEALREELSNSHLLALASQSNVILPLNLYDHSGISMSASSFIGRAQHAEWDFGQVGWIYATAEEIQKEYGDCSAENMEKTKAVLQGEVETYDYYLSGQCYGFRLYENGEETDSCWGFLGSLSEVLKDIACNLPQNHRDMVDNLQEVSDSRSKDIEDYMEDLEEMEV